MRHLRQNLRDRAVLLRDHLPERIEIRLQLADVVLQSTDLVRRVVQCLSSRGLRPRIDAPRERDNENHTENSHYGKCSRKSETILRGPK